MLSSQEMIARLVAFDTSSCNSNLPLIEFVSSYLASFGARIMHLASPDGEKANLHAILGQEAPGGVVLSGHTDVVSTEGQVWKTDPWNLTKIDDRLHGRGTADMKSFIAIALALVPEFVERGLKVPLHFVLSYDEEIGCVGARSLIAHMIDRVEHPRVVIVGEPSSMRVVTAHKGSCAYTTSVRAAEAYSNQIDGGYNVIAVSADLMRFLEETARKQQESGYADGRFSPSHTSVHLVNIEYEQFGLGSHPSCRFDWDVRPVPGGNDSFVIDRFISFAEGKKTSWLQAGSPRLDILTEVRHRVPSYSIDENSPAVQLMLNLTEQRETEAWSLHTESGLFQEAGFPTVLCGPGELLQAHKPNESIGLDDIDAAERFFRRLMEEICMYHPA